jgi:hypothetical protein
MQEKREYVRPELYAIGYNPVTQKFDTFSSYDYIEKAPYDGVWTETRGKTKTYWQWED